VHRIETGAVCRSKPPGGWYRSGRTDRRGQTVCVVDTGMRGAKLRGHADMGDEGGPTEACALGHQGWAELSLCAWVRGLEGMNAGVLGNQAGA